MKLLAVLFVLVGILLLTAWARISFPAISKSINHSIKKIGMMSVLVLFVCTGLYAQGKQFTAEYHIIIPDDGEVRMEKIYTRYSVTHSSIYYADKTTKKRFRLLMAAKDVDVFPSVEDALRVSEYTTEDRSVLIFTEYATGDLEYLVYSGHKGIYFAVEDKKLAEQMFENIKKERARSNRLARS